MGHLAGLQARLLDRAYELLRPGGLLVFCTCSLEPEEGSEQIAKFLARTEGAARVPISAAEIGGAADWITPEGELRTLPYHLPNAEPKLAGMDGFFAVRVAKGV